MTGLPINYAVWHEVWISLLNVSRLQLLTMNISSEQPLRFTIYPDMVVVSKEVLFTSGKLTDKAKIMLENRTTKKNSFMSDATRRKIKKILSSWHSAIYYGNLESSLALIKPERFLTFCTLTLSDEQRHDDGGLSVICLIDS